jgi:hypothetical protein
VKRAGLALLIKVAVTRPMFLTRCLFSWISLARNFASLESFECPSQESQQATETAPPSFEFD